ncbi:MAG: efflux RND transporter periplasmic adaptor subunit [Pirellulaceae bacterium]|nr:efflux RND transporter periplasmic adaptor subunit [Pirellulaceae bacterium]
MQFAVPLDLWNSGVVRSITSSRDDAGRRNTNVFSDAGGSHLRCLFVVAVAICFGAGCKSESSAPSAKIAPKVVCAPALVQKITDYDSFVGRTEEAESVEVRSRLSGFLRTIEFKDGAFVKEGDLLATIEPDEYQAIHNQSLARITLWEAKLDLAKSKMRRSQSLIKTSAISQEELDEAVSGVKEAEASLFAAQSDAARTELDLKYTKILSPISGRIDRALVTPGNMLTGGLGNGTLITRIVSVSPVYAYLDVDESTILGYIRKAQANAAKSAAAQPTEAQLTQPTEATSDEASKATNSHTRASLRDLNVPCYLQLNDESEAKHQGVLDFVENRVDKTTGTIRIRGIFQNEEGVLRGGMFVRAKVPVSEPYEAVLIPETAIGTDQNFKFAYVIDASNKPIRRNLKLGAAQGPLRIVREGISVGERVVIRGIQRVRPDVEVEVQMEEIKLPTARVAEGAAK